MLLSLTRWIHYIAGVMWIGHLWFFNFVNLNYQSEVPADLKKTVNPPLLVRALFFFRWGAMFTFLSGLILLALLWGNIERWQDIQGMYMAVGGLAGTIMFLNVWLVIWPNQKKIITGMQGGPAADPSLAPKALLASRINTYLSVPMLLGMMGGAHKEYTLLEGSPAGLVLGIVLGLALVWTGYKFAPKLSSKLFQG